MRIVRFDENEWAETVANLILAANGSPFSRQRIRQTMEKIRDVDETEPKHDPRVRCLDALEMISRYGGIDGGHHKQWVLDQVVRILTGPGYADWLRLHCAGDDGPETYDWDEGIAP